MNKEGISRILEFVGNMIDKARVTYSDGRKEFIRVKKIERKEKTIRIFFYIPADQKIETITRIELIDNRGFVIDEQTDIIEKLRRQGFMTAFEYTYKEG